MLSVVAVQSLVKSKMFNFQVVISRCVGRCWSSCAAVLVEGESLYGHVVIKHIGVVRISNETRSKMVVLDEILKSWIRNC